MYTLHYDPFREIRRFHGYRSRALWAPSGLAPLSLDVVEREDGVAVTASLPGFKPEDIDVTIEDHILTISADAQAAEEIEDARYILRERHAGAVRRSIRLPEIVTAEGAQTAYEHGVLTVTLPKAEERKPRRLAVSAN